jgi:two-component system OmpR family sensor kinase
MRFALAIDSHDVAQLQRDLIDNIVELERTATEYLRYAEQEAQHSVLHLVPIKTHTFFSALQHHYQHSSKQLQWHFPEQGHFYGDEFGLQRALCNLIDNAEQHASHTIVIRFKQAHQCCVVTIDDDGPGIPHLARQQFGRQTAFDPQRVRGQREQGFGLGLYIVRRVAMLHRGHLRISESPQHGARFQLLWPDRT